jgi:hypothetical protein
LTIALSPHQATPDETRIRAASAAIALIAEELGMRVAVTLLWCAFEECAYRLQQEKTNRD